MGSVVEMILFGICVFLGVLIHEFGHALVARHYGYRPEIVLHALGGVTLHNRPANSRQDFFITLAGPVAGLIVGGVLYGVREIMVVAGLGGFLLQHGALFSFLTFMIWVNLAWGVFNLLPCRPMDGGKVLGHILRKFVSENKAELVGVVISVIFAGLLLVWSILSKSMWMIFISAYFLMFNLSGVKAAFQGVKGEAKPKKRLVGIQAEALYEKGRTAAREHDWKSLEMYGYQMQKAAEGEDQVERAYELLTIACTNLGKYEEALNYSAHARESDAVRQAIERCKAMID